MSRKPRFPYVWIGVLFFAVFALIAQFAQAQRNESGRRGRDRNDSGRQDRDRNDSGRQGNDRNDTGRQAPILVNKPIDENDNVTLNGNTHPEANSENDEGDVDDDYLLEHMLLQLKRSPEQERALQQYLEELQTPGSPNFQRWLTAKEFGQRFGVSSIDIDTLTRWLQKHGLQVNVIYPSGMVIDFSGTARQVQRTFHADIRRLRVKGKNHVGNINDPKIPAAFAPMVAGIVSLHDFSPHSMHQMRKASRFTFGNPLGGTNYAVAPADLATIYNLNPLFNSGYSGQGQTVAVIEDTDIFSAADWKTFRSTFGLSKYSSGSFRTMYPAPPTGVNNCRKPGVIAPNDAEAILDAEWASAAAPSASILMATCADTTITFGGLIALQNLINANSRPPAIMSISYGQCETENGAAANAAYNAAYQQAVSEGVSVFVASGDSGAAGCDNSAAQATHGIGVNAFASTPYNVAVGGTDFSDTYAGTNSSYWNSANTSAFGSARSYISEIPWNDSCAGALFASYEGFNVTSGPSSLCNDPTLGPLTLSTVAGGGGPSACATGTPSTTGVVGGTCNGWPKPSWQSIYGNPNDGVRDTPDISLFAADGLWGHYYVFCWSDTLNGGAACSGDPSAWSGAGGTSFSSPIMAGIQAIVNQKAGARQGNPNPVYYKLAANEYSTSNGNACNSSNGAGVPNNCIFYDVTQGDVDVNCTGNANCFLDSSPQGVLSTSNTSFKPAYGATTGWDFATGIGSLNAANLVNNWPGTKPIFTLSTSSSSVSVIQGSTGSTTVIVTPWNGFAGTVSFSASGLPSGVTASFNPASSKTNAALTLTASGSATPGTSTVTVTGTSGTLSNTTAISLTVVAPASFNLSASPATVSLVQGTSGTTTVTVAPQNGFAGTVAFSASGLPSGVTGSFNPGGSTTSSTLTLTASSTALPGGYTVTVTGTSGVLTNTTSITLTITAAPSFTLSASPNSVSIVQGASGTSTITVTLQNGFSGRVTMAASGLLTGVTATFSPASATSSSTLTLSAVPTASTGTVTLSISGTSGSLTSATPITLTVIAAPTFTLSASPNSLSVVQGTSGTSTITIVPQNGFTSAVSLSTSALPSGVTASFNPASATNSSTLTLTATGTAATGSVTVTITGTSGTVTSTTSVALTVNAASTSNIPPTWLDVDIGSVGLAGSASYANGVFTVNGAGTSAWGTADGINFAYQPMSGDGTIVARVLTVSAASTGGVMIRDTLNANAMSMFVAYYNSAIYSNYRITTGGSTSQYSSTAVGLPHWVKLVRSGSTFSSYASPDGVNWVQFGTSQTITMGQNVYVGLGVSSANTAVLATATFDNVSITSAAAPAPVISSLSAASGVVGSQVVISGSGFGAPQGSSIVTLNGTLATVNAWSATSITITIPAGATSGPLAVVVAPSMNSSNSVTFAVTAPLPSGWLDQDVGSVGLAGSASYATGVFTVSGSGQYIWDTADGMHFLYQSLVGDCTIIARVASLQGGTYYDQAGVMIRESLAANSANAFGSYQNPATYFLYRSSTAGITNRTSSNNVTLPYWVKLVRRGSTFSSYSSPDGVNWVQVGTSQTITMAQNVYVGLAVSSDNNASTLATATFDNVSVTTP